MDSKIALTSLSDGSSLRTAVGSLASTVTLARKKKAEIIDKLAEIISAQADVVYGPTPSGMKQGEPQRYERMIRAAVIEQAVIQAVLAILGPDGLLDNERFTKLVDKSGMLGRLGRWHEHIKTMRERAAEAAKQFSRKHRGVSIQKVKIFGLGGSGAPHDVAKDIVSNFRKSSVEIEVVHADTPNPDCITPHTLAIFCSFSGNTEETLHCYDMVSRKTRLRVALAKGGKLRELARRANMPFIQLPEENNHPAFVMQPRESVCLQMTAIITFLASIGLPAGSGGSLTVDSLAFDKALGLIDRCRKQFGPQIPFRRNPAKQLAFFLLYGIKWTGRGKLPAYDLWGKKVPFILVDRNNAAIGHEVRTQIHERAKLNAGFNDAPELLHNMVESIRAGVESAKAGFDPHNYVYYFIRSADEEPRIRLRLDKTIELVMERKANYAVLNAEGENPFHRALFATYFNAHMTTYLAILNGLDPLPVPTMSWLKNVMEGFKRDGREERKANAHNRSGLEMWTARVS
ncbi:MAG: SIS domain-containing protein [Verrucomicrobiota bacterium]